MGLSFERNGAATLLLAAAFFALFMLKGALTVAPPVDPAHEFDAARALARLGRILGDERPHPVDSAANDALRERLLAEIRAIGYEPEVRDDFACRASKSRKAVACARVRNVVFRAGPKAGGAALVASHYDSVPAGPGAADDGSGVAATLEIAAVLKKRQPKIPVIFLMTDGEEPGLIGAHSFVRKDPLAKDIDAVINMEARGVSGPAILFETSDPNGRDIKAYSARAKAPVGNSLAADIYRMLPNDTDMTEFLSLGSDGVNLAFSDGFPSYHTPRDNLAKLDQKSFAHIGTSALAALDGFARDIDRTDRAPERQSVFVDVLARSMIVVPRMAALAMIIAGLAAAVSTFFASPGPRRVRAALAPLAAMAGAGALALLSQSLIASIRPEASYWSAAPHWTRAVIYLSAIASAAGALAISGGADRRLVLAASWFWFSLVGLIAYAAAPGSAILTGLPAALFACAALASAGAARLLAPISCLGVAAALILFLPLLHQAEVGLGLGRAWPFAILAALLFMLAAPVVTRKESIRFAVVFTPLAALFAAMVLALTAPAYSPSAPRPLNVQHVVDAATRDAYFILSPSGERPPSEMDAARKFEVREIDGLSGERYAAPAPEHDGRAVGVEILSSTPQESGRMLTLRFTANGADEIVLIIPEEAALARISAGGEDVELGEGGAKYIRCTGRSCADLAITAFAGKAPAEWTVIGVRHGLGSDGEAVAKLRPGSAVPAHGGDARLTLSRQLI